jgi:hypothetical protein
MELNSEVVEFRDGTKLTVTEANWETDMRVGVMENDAQRRMEELIHNRDTSAPLSESEISWSAFIQGIYPKLAACSTGAVPSEEEAYHMPSTERDKWYDAAHRLNSHWFVALDAATARMENPEKKGRKRTASTKS